MGANDEGDDPETDMQGRDNGKLPTGGGARGTNDCASPATCERHTGADIVCDAKLARRSRACGRNAARPWT